MGTCLFRPKQNVGWARPKKPSRPTLNIFYASPKQKNFLCRKKNIICQRVFFKKNCAMSAEKYQLRLFHDQCRLLSIQFIPWTKFAWCRLGNVRSASSNDASFLDHDRSSFLADVEYHFFYQYRWIIFFCRVGLMFSWPNNWEHAISGRNKMSVELAQKNLADLHCKFLMQHQNKKTSSAIKKHCLPASVFKKNCAMSAEKYQSRLFRDRCRLLSFQFIPWTKFAWCRWGNVRSASSDDASFLDPDRSSFLADADCHFFFINIGE